MWAECGTYIAEIEVKVSRVPIVSLDIYAQERPVDNYVRWLICHIVRNIGLDK